MLRSLNILLLFSVMNTYVPITTSESTDWAQHDLQFIHDAIHDNHPGMYNELDPDFSSHLDLFYQETLQQLNDATSDNDCKTILRAFGKRFNDNHLGIGFTGNDASTSSAPQSDEPFSYSEITSDVLWIRIPRFMLQEADKPIMESIIAAMPTYRTYPYIVFDLRGNRGGSSMWGERITDTLFGKTFAHAERARAQALQYIEWRASAGNLHYFNSSLIPYVTNAFGAESDTVQWALAIQNGITQAYNAGNIYYREETKYNAVVNNTTSLYTNTIIAIIDNHCGSACLDFIDELKLLSTKIVLIGQQTGADSLYMEVRNISLPSGKGFLGLPIKVYRNRPRGHNIPYVPDIAYYDDIKDTQKVQAFVIQYLHNHMYPYKACTITCNTVF